MNDSLALIVCVFIIALVLHNAFDRHFEVEMAKAGLIQCESKHNTFTKIWQKECK